MGKNSKIEWTDHTWNPWIGCTHVSEGCRNCYAEADFDKRRHVVEWGLGKPRVRPRVIFLENVEEFQDWGPLKNGQPVKLRKGETFQQWVGHLRAVAVTA